MKVKQKTKFLIELNDQELNQFYDWLAKEIELHPYTATSRPKIVDDIKSTLYGFRHGI